MKNRICISFLWLLSASTLLAQSDGRVIVGPSIWETLWHCALFGALGIILVIAGFKIFDKVITKIDLEAEIAKGNVACALLSAAAIIAIGIIVAAAIN